MLESETVGIRPLKSPLVKSRRVESRTTGSRVLERTTVVSRPVSKQQGVGHQNVGSKKLEGVKN